MSTDDRNFELEQTLWQLRKEKRRAERLIREMRDIEFDVHVSLDKIDDSMVRVAELLGKLKDDNKDDNT